MGVSISDLSPKYQQQAAEKILAAEREKRERRRDSLSAVPEETKNGGGGQRKYHNQPTERITAAGNVLKFDSQKEARRYDTLTARLQRGEIRDLRLQVVFTLQEAFTDTEGKRVRAVRYIADFTYQERTGGSIGPPYKTAYQAAGPVAWRLVVEDVKSKATRTQKYTIKKKLMKDKYGIDIQEV